MRIRSCNDRQLNAWLLAGLTAPVAGLAGKMPWQNVALIGVVCVLACCLVGRFGTAPSRWMGDLEYLWMIYVLSWLLRKPSESWISETAYPAVPLILLALAAVSASRGLSASARTGSCLFWLIALVFAGVIAAGAGEVETKELLKSGTEWDPVLPMILLIPALVIYGREGGGKVLPASLGIGTFAVVISLLVVRTLSLEVGMISENPFREWVSGLSLVGTLQRFDALVSVALTMGWFTLLSFVLCVAGRMREGVNENSYGKGVLFAAVSGGTLMLLPIAYSSEIVLILCVILWFVAPIVWNMVTGKKN